MCPDDMEVEEDNNNNNNEETNICGRQENGPYNVAEFHAGSMEFIFYSGSQEAN